MNNTLANAQSNIKCTFDGQVFFYCLPSGFQSLSICIAEGLKQLEIPFYSNINYWQVSPEQEDYLFCHNPNVTPDDCAVVVVEKAWVSHHRSFPENLFHSGRKYVTVYLDDMDGPTSPAFYPAARNFDFIFRTHLNNQVEYPTNFVPWVFGLSNRILRETSELPNFQHKTRHLLANFRTLQDHVDVIFFGDNPPPVPPGMLKINSECLKVEYPLRQIFSNQFSSLVESILSVDWTVDYFDQPPMDSYHYCQWKQTRQRHNPAYYQRLKAAVACAAFGGYVVPATNSTPPYLEWWDSWRFWESLAAGCVTFHVDLDKYGAVMPVMPENWRHYIGVDLDNLEDAVERIASEPEILEHISLSGHRWAIENYGSVPTAVRFLETISGNPLGGDRSLRRKDYPLTTTVSGQLSEINLIIFPDWFQEEDSLCQELERVIRAIASHPDRRQMHLLIDTSHITEEEADLVLSSVVMNLLLEEDLDVSESAEISLLRRHSETHWKLLLPTLHARIVLEKENERARTAALPCCELESFSKRRAVEFYLNLGNQLFQEENWQGTIEQYQGFLKIQTGDVDLYSRLSECFRYLNLLDQAVSTLKEGLRLYPTEARLHFTLILNLQRSGRIPEAITSAKTASSLLPHDYTFKILSNLLLPRIYQTQDEISFYRQGYIQGIQNLIVQTPLETPEQRKSTLAGISHLTNFYLSYQGQNDRELQRQYGNLLHKIMAANYPEWVAPLSMPPLNKQHKIRIGYVSAYLHCYSGTLWLTGWLRYCDCQNFEIYCYYIGNEPDPITKKFQEYSDVFHHIPYKLEAACEQIIANQLHILVFPEIGMNPLTMQMAALRLAPVQCVAWGHPVTSGLPTIDYFLSSELMEPENAQEHYSEKLIRLPNIGVSYPKPYIPPLIKTRLDFQLRDNSVIYLCCQSPFKYLPQYDFIFAEIARRVPQAQFLFLRGEILQPRLSRAFAAAGFKSENYCVFLTIPERLDYLMINLLSDVYLDTFDWSGGNTTLEAIACHLPVVTCPGEFMRGRHSDSFLKMLGVTDTIAQNEAEYIEIAARLGLDPAWRRKIAERMQENQDRLFDDKACVAGLEVFCQQVVWENLAQPSS